MRDFGLVSIITPNYNCGRFIALTISSVLAQSYQNWEMLIQDDCSTDESMEAIRRLAALDDRIKVEKNPLNAGAAVCRNNALKRANGKWIAFLDSDDLWQPDKLHHQLQFMVDNGIHFSYTTYCEINEKSIETGVKVLGPKHINKLGMYCYCWPGCLTVMYDREYVGLVQIADIKRNNDYAMWLKICHKSDCFFLNDCLAKYRRGLNGSISNQSLVTLIKWHYKLFRDAEELSRVSSFLLTGLNLVCGIYKKIRYIKRYN